MIKESQPLLLKPAHHGDASPRPVASAPVKVCRPRRQTGEGNGSHLTQETRDLLRLRLRSSAVMLLVGFSVFLARHLVGVLTVEPLRPSLLAAHILVVFVLSWNVRHLCRTCPVPTRKLQLAELGIFGFPTGFFLLLQFHETLTDAAAGYATPPMSFWPLLIFTYALFIPNSWRRAAYIIGAMALAPSLLVIGMTLAHPPLFALMTVADVMHHMLTMVISAVAAVFGTHLINTLRREAYEARQLGQYRLIKLLGAGGMGEVYLAEHRMLKRPCAIKLIRPEKAGDPQVLARFEREVQMTARLSHWNTVEIFDYGRTEDGTFYYVMEYLPGLSLEQLLDRHGPLPAERVVHLMRQACQALSEAHNIGLIHRDIKPANIVVAQRGGHHDVVKLLDFGLVKPISGFSTVAITNEGAISGTPLYMSPEQARGAGELDGRSDIYSLAAVAYTLLTGHPPFERSSPLEVIIAHARDPVPPVSNFRTDISTELERIIHRCLEKDPADRFQNADELDQALAQSAVANLWQQQQAAAWWAEHDRDATELSEPVDIWTQLTDRFASGVDPTPDIDTGQTVIRVNRGHAIV